MKADVFKAGDAFRFAEVVAVALAKAQDGAARPEHFFPEAGERMSGGAGVHSDLLRRGGRVLARRRFKRGRAQQNGCQSEVEGQLVHNASSPSWALEERL